MFTKLLIIHLTLWVNTLWSECVCDRNFIQSPISTVANNTDTPENNNNITIHR